MGKVAVNVSWIAARKHFAGIMPNGTGGAGPGRSAPPRTNIETNSAEYRIAALGNKNHPGKWRCASIKNRRRAVKLLTDGAGR
jgi:hypothetical protein